jgi:hypothetical protein
VQEELATAQQQGPGAPSLQVSRFGHGKTHACVRASMTVANRVPEGLQVRVAATPTCRRLVMMTAVTAGGRPSTIHRAKPQSPIDLVFT